MKFTRSTINFKNVCFMGMREVSLETTKDLLANWVYLAQKVEEAIPKSVSCQVEIFWNLEFEKLPKDSAIFLSAEVDLGVLMRFPASFRHIIGASGRHQSYATAVSVGGICILSDKVGLEVTLGGLSLKIGPTATEAVAKDIADILVTGKKEFWNFIVSDDVLGGVWKRAGFTPVAK